MTPGGTPKQAAKRLIAGTPLEGPARRLVNDWQVSREPKRTMDAILRYTNPVPRYGEGKPSHPELARIIDAGRDRYAALLGRLGDFVDVLGRVPVEPSLPSLDAIAHFISRDPELAQRVPIPRADPLISAGEPTGPTSFWLHRNDDRAP